MSQEHRVSRHNWKPQVVEPVSVSPVFIELLVDGHDIRHSSSSAAHPFIEFLGGDIGVDKHNQFEPALSELTHHLLGSVPERIEVHQHIAPHAVQWTESVLE